MSKERPILFSAPMVCALLDGSKTQTRRIVKPAPQMVTDRAAVPWEGPPDALLHLLAESGKSCPYGKPGDRLYVRETWRTTGDGGRADYLAPRAIQPHPVWYDADGAAPADQCTGKTRVSIHMPRWASRILLEIVSVRVEQLNDISEADARAEGATIEDRYMNGCCAGEFLPPSIRAFSELWESINGAGSWSANPWVWVIEFKRVIP